MPIRPSSGAEIRSLISALGGSDDVAREAAVGRLAVIGPRAVSHLLQEFPDASARQRHGILRALGRLGDAAALPLARDAVRDPDPATALAAVGVLRSLLRASGEDGGALDALVAAALDPSLGAALRNAAFDALRNLPAPLVDPIRARLASDPDEAVSRHAAGDRVTAAPAGGWPDVVTGTLPATPAELKELLGAHLPQARLTELQRLVDHVRVRESRETDAASRAEWRAIRGLLHQALAARGSRLALYDLRDSLLETGPLPVTFLAALEEIGDASCVEPLAAAYDASSPSGDLWWREHIASAFRAIVRREGLTRRHLVVKRALARWPGATADLMGRA
jgi:HEAT repeat protein